MSDKKPAPYSKGWRYPKQVTITRGTPIKKMSYDDGPMTELRFVEKINELIERINQMNTFSGTGGEK